MPRASNPSTLARPRRHTAGGAIAGARSSHFARVALIVVTGATLLVVAPAGAAIQGGGTAAKGLDIRYAFVDAAVAPQYRGDFTLHLHDGIVSRQTDGGVVSVTVPATVLRRLAKTAPSLPHGTFDAPRGCVGGTTRRLRVRQDGRTVAKATVQRCGSANRAETTRLERYVAPLLELLDAN